MRRTIRVQSKHIRIEATLDTKEELLTRDEINEIRDELADTLQDVVSRVRCLGMPRYTVKVT